MDLISVPGKNGGNYTVQVDSDQAVSLNDFKGGVDDCTTSHTFRRAGLDGSVTHKITVVLGGASPGDAGSTGLFEFSGLLSVCFSRLKYALIGL